MTQNLPQTLTEWLDTLDPKDQLRELKIASKNLKRIYNHVKTTQPTPKPNPQQ